MRYLIYVSLVATYIVYVLMGEVGRLISYLTLMALGFTTVLVIITLNLKRGDVSKAYLALGSLGFLLLMVILLVTHLI